MKRTVGVVAVVLGAAGVVLGVVLAIAAVRVMVGVHERVDGALAGITTTLETAAARIDAAEGEAAAAVLESADEAIEALEANPLVGLLPVDTEAFATQVQQLQETVEQGPGRDQVAAVLDETMSELDDFRDRLRMWLRLGAIAVLLLAVWAVWAQVELLRSGIGRLRGGGVSRAEGSPDQHRDGLDPAND